MQHTIEFRTDLTIDRERSPKDQLERLLIPKGLRVRAQLKPYVHETKYGPVEVADLYFEDGTITRCIPFACFEFVEERCRK